MPEVVSEDVDKKKIYAQEKKIMVEWLKTVCEKQLDDVKALAQRYLDSGSVTSLDSLFREFVDGEGHTAIHFAASRNHIDTAKWILEEDPECIDILDNNGYSALAHACIGQFYDMVEFLLSKGASLNPTQGIPPIIKGIDNQDKKLIELLLERGADINCKTSTWNESAFHYACANNCNAVIPLLLSHGADVNEKDRQGVTPLIYAAVNTNASLLKLFLSNHADATICLPGGISPLHIVCEAGHMASFQAFKENEKFVELANRKDDNGLLPIVYAGEKNHSEIIQELLPVSKGFEDQSVEDVIRMYTPDPSKEKESKPAPPETVLSAEDKELIHKKKIEGVQLFNQSKYEEAIKVFETVLLLNPNDEVIFSNMSSCYLRLKNYSKAMEYAEICIKLKPKWPKGYYRKGMVFFEQENYVDSATSFYMGCELDPKDKKLSSMFQDSIERGKRQHAEEEAKKNGH